MSSVMNGKALRWSAACSAGMLTAGTFRWRPMVSAIPRTVMPSVPCLVAGMIGGADSIDDMDLRRHGAMPAVFGGIRAPSILGSFLRSFTLGNVLQLRHPCGSGWTQRPTAPQPARPPAKPVRFSPSPSAWVPRSAPRSLLSPTTPGHRSATPRAIWDVIEALAAPVRAGRRSESRQIRPAHPGEIPS